MYIINNPDNPDIPNNPANENPDDLIKAEHLLANATSKTKLFELFGTPAYFTSKDFLWMLADSISMGPQYGYKDEMCKDPPPPPTVTLANPDKPNNPDKPLVMMMTNSALSLSLYICLICTRIGKVLVNKNNDTSYLLNLHNFTIDHYGEHFPANCYYSTACMSGNNLFPDLFSFFVSLSFVLSLAVDIY